jgi:hypothetical protein
MKASGAIDLTAAIMIRSQLNTLVNPKKRIMAIVKIQLNANQDLFAI